ncbi:hypothetical protein A2U01_0057074, partial [Trifolium medium]|nr:hypothetical protein [Trifolium medium]
DVARRASCAAPRATLQILLLLAAPRAMYVVAAWCVPVGCAARSSVC